jgi:hypothetical protein
MAAALKDRRKHDVESDKDSTEEELERLVFGDSAGFRDNIRSFRDSGSLARGKELVLAEDGEEHEDGTGLEGLADQDLFFLDDAPENAAVVPIITTDDESVDGREVAAWTDSDDERITVSLASRSQLRKLRKTEADDIVTGKEYSKRLRKQFQLLNSVPEWVLTATGSAERAKKKRRTSEGSEVTDTSEDEDGMDIDDEEGGALSAQPLARLLQDVDSLTRTSHKNGASKKRKLRPEVIDIQRMKDIVSSSPVSHISLSLLPHRTNEFPVRNNLSPNTPLTPPPHLLRAFQNNFHPSPPSTTTGPQSPPHNSPPQTYSITYHTLPSLSKQRRANLPFWSTPLFPRLEPLHWPRRKSATHLRPR